MDKLQRIYDTIGRLDDDMDALIDKMGEEWDDDKGDAKLHERKKKLYYALVEAWKKVRGAGCDIQPFVKKQ